MNVDIFRYLALCIEKAKEEQINFKMVYLNPFESLLKSRTKTKVKSKENIKTYFYLKTLL